MAGLFEGSAPPDVTTTTTKQQSAPQYLTDYLTNLAQVGQNLLGTPGVGPDGKPTFTSKTGEDLIADRPDYLTNLVSGIDPKTNKPITDQLPGLQDLSRYQTPLDQALTAGKSAMEVTSDDISRFYDPYEKDVIDKLRQSSDVNLMRRILPALKTLGVSGGAGSSQNLRTQGIGGQALADVESGLLSQEAALRSAGYKSALDAALKEQGQQASAASALSNLGQIESTAAPAALKTLADLGTQQLQYGQSKIEAPLTRASNVAALLRNYQFPLSSTDTFKGPMAGITYGPSTFDKIGSLTSFLTGIKTGSGSGKAGTLGADIGNFIKSFGSGTDNLTPEQAASIDEFVNNLEFDG